MKIKDRILRELSKKGNAIWLVIIFGYALSIPSGLASESLSANLLVFVSSLLLLLKSADYLVSGASRIAVFFGISPLIIGITVVAFGTSLPELTVSTIANLAGSADISVANIVGSNISNICLVLGIAAILAPIAINRNIFRFDIPFLVGVTMLLPILTMGMFFEGTSLYVIGLIDGIILIGVFAFFMYAQETYAMEEHHHKKVQHATKAVRERRRNKLLGYLLVVCFGLTFLIISAGLLVESSINIAQLFGVPEAIIGLTMVAIGTSLPELATNVVAAFKKKLQIAVGNVIGSNIFNILLVLGTASVIKPITNISSSTVLLDMPVMIGVTALLVILMWTRKKLSRIDGMLLVGIYIVYLVFIATRLISG
jgi:cation:H+ antiporter